MRLPCEPGRADDDDLVSLDERERAASSADEQWRSLDELVSATSEGVTAEDSADVSVWIDAACRVDSSASTAAVSARCARVA